MHHPGLTVDNRPVQNQHMKKPNEMEYKTCILVVLVTLAVCQENVFGIACPPNYCDSVNCGAMITRCPENALLVPNGSFCGCCPICRTQLGESESCPMSPPGMPTTAECREPLRCVDNVCRQ